MFFQPQMPPARIRLLGAEGTLTLTRSVAEDVSPLVASLQASMPELRAFMPWAHFPENNTEEAQAVRLERNTAQWNDKQDFTWHLSFEGARVVGSFGLHPRCLNPLGREVGYWIDSRWAGRGLCTRAVQMIVVMGFEKMGLERLQVGCDVLNTGSRRVIEKVGFVEEGVLRQMLPSAPPNVVEAGWCGTGDMVLYALTRDDFEVLDWVGAVREKMSYDTHL
jgi:RimJ/RimL family protein N-acetyltransferase